MKELVVLSEPFTLGITGTWRADFSESVFPIMTVIYQEYPVHFLIDSALFTSEFEHLRKYFQQIPECTIVPIKELVSRSDYVFSFGGDGTFLRTSRMIGKRKTPIVGVNFGKLGFLTEFDIDELPELLQTIVKNEVKIENRMVLESTITLPDGTPLLQDTLWALNDVVVDKSGYSRLISLNLSVNDTPVGVYRADGVIISTSAGSTGYSLACGGPIMHPETNSLLITPVSPHSLTIRPLVIPASAEIKIVAETQFENMLVCADGNGYIFEHKKIIVTIKKSKEMIKVVKNNQRTYFDTLKTKLMWTIDGRN